jgi:hypothetical protein
MFESALISTSPMIFDKFIGIMPLGFAKPSFTSSDVSDDSELFFIDSATTSDFNNSIAPGACVD